MATIRIKFSEGWLKTLKPAGVLTEYRDTHQAGLALRVMPTGKRTWTLIGNIRGAGSPQPYRGAPTPSAAGVAKRLRQCGTLGKFRARRSEARRSW